MNTYLQSDHPPTDIMCSRTPLLFLGHFQWLDKWVSIRTDSPEILRAAENAGLRKAYRADQACDLRWDVVAEQQAPDALESWQCEVVEDGKSLHLNMGSRQWFAFDLETGDGAGFVAAGSDWSVPQNAEEYFRAIMKSVSAVLFQLRKREGDTYGD